MKALAYMVNMHERKTLYRSHFIFVSVLRSLNHLEIFPNNFGGMQNGE